MRIETLVAAYSAILKRKYTTRARLAKLCSFTVMTAGNAARELKRLGLVSERIFPSAGKLSPLPLCFSMVTAGRYRISLTKINGSVKPVSLRWKIRNYSFHTMDNIALLLNECYEPDGIFPVLFCRGIPELELKIFGDMLPPHIVIPDDVTNVKEFMIYCLIKQKIEEKALANPDEM